MSAFVVINGVQVLECRLPTMSERQCSVYSNADSNLRVMNDYGRFEISWLCYVSGEIAQLEHRPWVAELVVDEGVVIALGQVPGVQLPPTVVSRYLPQMPRSFQFRIRYDDSPWMPHPWEEELVNELRLVLLDQQLYPPGAPVSYSNLCSRVESLEVFKRVIEEHYKGRGNMFFLNHKDAFLCHQVPGDEMKVSLAFPAPQASASTSSAADPLTAPARLEEDEKILSAVTQILRPGPVTTAELLQRLQNSVFTTHLKPSASILFRFLRAHRESFWVKWDPLHTTRCGLTRRDGGDGNWDNAAEWSGDDLEKEKTANPSVVPSAAISATGAAATNAFEFESK